MSETASIDFVQPASPRGEKEPREVALCGVCRKPVSPKLARGGKPKKWCSPECCRMAWERAHPGKRGWQAALPGESRVERAFAEWIETPAGQYVEAEVVKLARLDKDRRGMKRGEINYYLAYVRRNSWGLAKDDDGYRCNNNHRSLLARRIMARHPGLEGFFETRELRGIR